MKDADSPAALFFQGVTKTYVQSRLGRTTRTRGLAGRGARRPLLLASILGLAPAFASAQTDEFAVIAGALASTSAASRPEPQDLIPELDKRKAFIEPKIHRLEEMKGLYVQDAANAERLAPERNALVAELKPLLSRYDELHEEFHSRKNSRNWERGTAALHLMLKGQLPPDVNQRMAQLMFNNDYGMAIREQLRKWQFTVLAEESAFMSALEVARSRRKWRLIVAVFVVALAAALGTAAWHAWARQRLLTEVVKGRGPLLVPAGEAPLALPGPRATPAATVLGGNYMVERELGRGGMGVVFQATDLSLRRKVAVKVLRDELLQSSSDLEMLLTEARLVASLKHPNVVAIHSIFKETGRVYLVFEYVEGETLHDSLNRLRRLPLPRVREVLRQVGGALEYAHGRRVIHRDLKPSNIMVCSARGGADAAAPPGPDDSWQVKVMDFGIAHQAKRTVARLTRAEAWGTPPYMPPEQELGTVSRQSDLYALGVCVYEMLTGEIPFPGPNFLAQKQEMVFAQASSIVPGLPPSVDAAIRKALAPDPAGRFANAEEMAAAFQA